MRPASKAALIAILQEQGLISVPTRVFPHNVSVDSGASSFAEELIGQFGACIVRTSSGSQMVNLPFRASSMPRQVQRYLANLPRHVDMVIIQAHEHIDMSFEFFRQGELGLIEAAPGTRITGEGGWPFTALVKLEGGSSPLTRSAARRMGPLWRDSIGFASSPTGGRRLAFNRFAEAPLSEMLGFAGRALAALEVRSIAGQIYAHHSQAFGWSAQNLRPAPDVDLRGLMNRRPTGQRGMRVDTVEQVDRLQPGWVPIIGASISRESTQSLLPIISALRRRGHQVVSTEAGILSHEAILLREAGFNVIFVPPSQKDLRGSK